MYVNKIEVQRRQEKSVNHMTSIYTLEWVSKSVSEWLLFNANSSIFQLYHGENKLSFNEMMMRSDSF
jgi:hypothetical protein